MVFLKRHLAHDTDYCKFELDEYRTDAGEQMLLAHLRVRHWSRATLKRIKDDWALFRSVVTSPLYATPMEDSRLWRQFVDLYGWRDTGQRVLCHDGIERPLYIHTI
jgi:hypothetical protein